MSKKRPSSPFVYSTDPDFKLQDDQEQTIATLQPDQQPLRMSLDTKHRAGKAVTVIKGFMGTEEDLETLGKKLKTTCGTGGAVKDGEIIIQGDHRDRLMLWFQKNGYAKAKRN